MSEECFVRSGGRCGFRDLAKGKTVVTSSSTGMIRAQERRLGQLSEDSACHDGSVLKGQNSSTCPPIRRVWDPFPVRNTMLTLLLRFIDRHLRWRYTSL